MASTLTVTATMPQAYSNHQPNVGDCIRRYSGAWVSHTDGTVNNAFTEPIVGEILRVQFVPDGGGTAPTNLYDVTLTDANGQDVLAGQGANLSDTVTTNVCPGVPLKDGTTTSVRPMVVAETLTLVIANAGNGKGGKVVLYVR